MKIEITLRSDYIETAVKEYLDKRGFTVKGDVKLSASPSSDYLDRPTGGYSVLAKAEAEPKTQDPQR